MERPGLPAGAATSTAALKKNNGRMPRGDLVPVKLFENNVHTLINKNNMISFLTMREVK